MKIHIKKKIQQFDYNEELHFVFFLLLQVIRSEREFERQKEEARESHNDHEHDDDNNDIKGV